jgi:hypothetical protein
MGNSRFFKGSLDEIYFYNRALTKNEISILFDREEEIVAVTCNKINKQYN